MVQGDESLSAFLKWKFPYLIPFQLLPFLLLSKCNQPFGIPTCSFQSPIKEILLGKFMGYPLWFLVAYLQFSKRTSILHPLLEVTQIVVYAHQEENQQALYGILLSLNFQVWHQSNRNILVCNLSTFHLHNTSWR